LAGWLVSQVDCGEIAIVDALARSIDTLGGPLDLVASFGDHTPKAATAEGT